MGEGQGMIDIRKWGRLPDFEAVIRRFPVATLTVAVLTVQLMLAGFDGTSMADWIPGYILGWYACVGVQLASESKGRSPKWLPLLKLTLVAVAVTLAALHGPTDFLPWLAVLAAIVFLGNAAWWGRGRDDAGVWLFTQRLWTGAIFALIGSVIFALGVIAIGATLDALFGVDLSDLAEHLILPLGLAFLAPVYWMGTLPHPRELDTGPDLSFEARALGFLGTWLLAPLVLIYGLIIVAYSFRVLLTWSLPDGETAILVTPFLVVGTLTWLVLQPTMLRAGALVRLYHRLWFPVALVSATLLAVAVWVRVAGYGLTPERVMLILLTLAALVLGAWFTVTGRRDIRIPTAAAAGFLLAGAFLAAPVADVTQLQRLRAGLASADKAAVARQVRDAAAYLQSYRAERGEWLEAELPGYDPDGDMRLDAYLRAQGYENAEQERERVRNEDYGSTYYRRGEPLNLRATPIFLGSYELTVMTGDDPKPDTWSVGEGYIHTGELLLSVDGRTLRREVEPVAESLFATRLASRADDMRSPDIYVPYERELHPSRDPILFDLADDAGRRYRLVVEEMWLNGEGDRLTGGRAEALLFSEP